MLSTEEKRLVGYSQHIADSAFAQGDAARKGGGMKYLQCLVPAALIAVLWAGGILPLPICVLLGLVCAALTLPPIMREQRASADQTYDGEIVSVERREPTFRVNARKIDAATRAKMVFHTIHVKDGHGSVHVYERTGDVLEDYRAYYRPGDRVRHHKGFDLPEKYDKSGDESVLCILCGRTSPIDARRCGACGAKLLK